MRRRSNTAAQRGFPAEHTHTGRTRQQGGSIADSVSSFRAQRKAGVDAVRQAQTIFWRISQFDELGVTPLGVTIPGPIVGEWEGVAETASAQSRQLFEVRRARRWLGDMSRRGYLRSQFEAASPTARRPTHRHSLAKSYRYRDGNHTASRPAPPPIVVEGRPVLPASNAGCPRGVTCSNVLISQVIGSLLEMRLVLNH
jgi:hypothetical protein